MAMLLKTDKRFLLGNCVIIILISISITSFSTHFKEMRKDQIVAEQPVLGNNYHLGGLEYLPDGVPSVEYIDRRGNVVRGNDGDVVNVQNLHKDKGITSFRLAENRDKVLELPLVYYKGYVATLDGNSLPVSESTNGLVQAEVNDEGYIEVYYEGTFIQKISWIISLLSILALCFYIFFYRNKNRII